MDITQPDRRHGQIRPRCEPTHCVPACSPFRGLASTGTEYVLGTSVLSKSNFKETVFPLSPAPHVPSSWGLRCCRSRDGSWGPSSQHRILTSRWSPAQGTGFKDTLDTQCFICENKRFLKQNNIMTNAAVSANPEIRRPVWTAFGHEL